MIKEINPSSEYLKAVTGKFDLDTIFNLDLQKKNISKLNAIVNCKSLVLLNLSNNKISSITGLDNCVDLAFLDLSFNSISSIDGIENLFHLRHLKLHGNNITKVPFEKLKQLTRLEKLVFQIAPIKEEKGLNTSNPICKDKNYRADTLQLLPQIKMLDGIGRDFETFIIEEDEPDTQNEDKLNPKNFQFDFEGKIKLNVDDVIKKDQMNEMKSQIEEKYLEFQKEIEIFKNYLKEIK